MPGAVNILRGLLKFRIRVQLYVPCQTGGRATLATRQLQDNGFTKVIAVIMDFEDGRHKNNPIL